MTKIESNWRVGCVAMMVWMRRGVLGGGQGDSQGRGRAQDMQHLNVNDAPQNSDSQ